MGICIPDGRVVQQTLDECGAQLRRLNVILFGPERVVLRNNFQVRVREAIQRRLFRTPFPVRHALYSMVFSEDDAVSRPSERILDISLHAIQRARTIDLAEISLRLRGRFSYPDSIINLWPGEHYRLLAALVCVLRPKLVVEIGTAEGNSALALAEELPPDGQVVTFDIVAWEQYPRSCLMAADLSTGRLRQIVADLGDSAVCNQYADLLRAADFVFIDAAKDGALERRILENLGAVCFRNNPILVLDDIRLWNMLKIWREIQLPKIDLTSFGHWCGTGLCEWTGLPVFGTNGKGGV